VCQCGVLPGVCHWGVSAARCARGGCATGGCARGVASVGHWGRQISAGVPRLMGSSALGSSDRKSPQSFGSSAPGVPTTGSLQTGGPSGHWLLGPGVLKHRLLHGGPSTMGSSLTDFLPCAFLIHRLLTVVPSSLMVSSLMSPSLMGSSLMGSSPSRSIKGS